MALKSKGLGFKGGKELFTNIKELFTNIKELFTNISKQKARSTTGPGCTVLLAELRNCVIVVVDVLGFRP